MTEHESSALHEQLSTGRPARLTREQSRALTRERLLASAAVVFTREGYGGASCDRIAEEAGYSKGALYSNFASKEELFFAMFDHYGRGQADELCRRLDAVPSADDVIGAVAAWADGMQHEPDLRMLVLDMARRARADAALAERYNRIFDEQWKEVGKRLARIFPSGQSPIPALKLGALVMEIAYGNAVQLHHDVKPGDLIGIALRALRGSASQG
jgi:AcrR family transcriptional regulator